MRKAICILDAIMSIAFLILSVIFIIVGFVCLSHQVDLVNQLVKDNPGTTIEVAQRSVDIMVASMLTSGFTLLAGAVVGIIIFIVVDKEISKVWGIIIGVIALILGLIPVGILMIIDSAINRD